jgi:hypothetical protein
MRTLILIKMLNKKILFKKMIFMKIITLNSNATHIRFIDSNFSCKFMTKELLFKFYQKLLLTEEPDVVTQ